MNRTISDLKPNEIAAIRLDTRKDETIAHCFKCSVSCVRYVKMTGNLKVDTQ